MEKTADRIPTENSLQWQCRQFGDLLGLDHPVQEIVLKAALQHESYSRNLLLSRETPHMLSLLLQNPPKITEEPGHSNLALLGKATTALLKWGKTGFTMVKPEVLERRENACMACPKLKDPKNLLQKIMPAGETNHTAGHRTGKKVCDLCGCNVSKKMRLPSEFCPDLHPENHQETRWGEPVPAFREAG